MKPSNTLKTLRLLRITPHFYRAGKWPAAFDPVGGLQNQTWIITQGLERAGVSQTVLTTYIPGSPRRVDLSDKLHVKCAGFWLPELLAGPLLCFTWFLASLPELLRARGRYDLVHIHFNHSVWCRAMALIVSWLKIPLVVSMNTQLWSGLQEALQLKGKPYDVTAWLEAKALHSAGRVVALTEKYGREAALGMGLDPRRVMVIADAVDAEDYQHPIAADVVSAFREEFRIPDDRPVVSFIGRISAEKGWQDFPALVERLSQKGVFLLICGDGPDRGKLESALSAARPGSFAITGFLSPTEVKTALAISDIMILPSRREALGSVLLEAMAAGVPTVAYTVGGVPDVAGTPPALALVSEGQFTEFIDRTLELIADRTARQQLVERGYKRARDFSLGSAVALNLDLYASMLAGRAKGSRRPAGTLALREDGGSPDVA